MWRSLSLMLSAILGASAGSRMPIFFVPNQGQESRSVLFTARASGLTARFLRREVLLSAPGISVRVRFEGAGSNSQVEGTIPLAGRVNFLTGNRAKWHRDVPTFGALRYHNLYPGIELAYAGDGLRLKSEFRVSPGADPARIRIRYTGSGPPVILPDGSLSIPAGEQRITEAAPYLYQERDGFASQVEGRYVLHSDGTIGFRVGVYDSARPLVIDPVLSYSLLIGGTGFTAATAIAVDSTGATYLAGYTDSTSLPAANPAQNFNAGGNEVFVARVNPAGTSLEYCTYLGGSNDDRAYALAVDASGAAFVAGSTTSANFPTLHAAQSTIAGPRDAFVFKLNPAGDLLVFSTFLGGNGADFANAIALDSSGNSYIAGDTTSMNFPATAFQTSYRGSQDAFVAKLSSDGGHLIFSTYLGGSSTDHAAGIAVDSGGTVYVAGSTWSADFPVSNAFQPSTAGLCDAFVARLRSDGNVLLFSSYLGGSGGSMGYPETAQAIALDVAGNAYVAGVTSSSDFPVKNAAQPILLGFTDAFVAKVNSSGALLFCTYLGGTGVEVANAIALDGSGAVFVAGYTYSTDFPVTAGAVQAGLAGECDAFLLKLTPSGDALLYATYLGGAGADTISGMALDAGGNLYLGGWTLSSNFPVVHSGT